MASLQSSVSSDESPSYLFLRNTMGDIVLVLTNDMVLYEGIFTNVQINSEKNTFSFDLELCQEQPESRLNDVFTLQKLSTTIARSTLNIEDIRSFTSDQVIAIRHAAPPINVSAFAIDSDIRNIYGKKPGQERELVSFSGFRVLKDDTSTLGTDHVDIFDDNSHRSGSWDQFSAPINASNVKFDPSEYAPQVDTSHPEYQKQLKIAKNVSGAMLNDNTTTNQAILRERRDIENIEGYDEGEFHSNVLNPNTSQYSSDKQQRGKNSASNSIHNNSKFSSGPSSSSAYIPPSLRAAHNNNNNTTSTSSSKTTSPKNNTKNSTSSPSTSSNNNNNKKGSQQPTTVLSPTEPQIDSWASAVASSTPKQQTNPNPTPPPAATKAAAAPAAPAPAAPPAPSTSPTTATSTSTPAATTTTKNVQKHKPFVPVITKPSNTATTAQEPVVVPAASSSVAVRPPAVVPPPPQDTTPSSSLPFIPPPPPSDLFTSPPPPQTVPSSSPAPSAQPAAVPASDVTPPPPAAAVVDTSKSKLSVTAKEWTPSFLPPSGPSHMPPPDHGYQPFHHVPPYQGHIPSYIPNGAPHQRQYMPRQNPNNNRPYYNNNTNHGYNPQHHGNQYHGQPPAPQPYAPYPPPQTSHYPPPQQ